MNHLTMSDMDKRPIVSNAIPDGGVLICRIGNFAVFLQKTGEFRMIDEKTGVSITMSGKEARDLCEVCRSVEDWSSYHHIVKK